jgi:asparagine synthase (glutamine-hydrolysing)
LPGVSAVFDGRGKIKEMESTIKDSLDQLQHDNHYLTGIPLQTDHIFLGFNRHHNYPVKVFGDDHLFFCADGFIYGKSRDEVESDIRRIYSNVLNSSDKYNNDKYREYLEDYMLSTEGEYAVFVFDSQKKEMLIFNDPLGRLPLYYLENEGFFVVSREPGFIINLTGEKGFDKRALFEYLLFGYPLECRTIFRDVRRLPGGSMLRVKVDNRPQIEKLSLFDFEEKTSESVTTADHADRIAEYLFLACRDRANPDGKNILALSGGLDSRAVAGGLKKSKVPFSAVTFLDYYGTMSPDIKYAGEIARELEVEWQLYTLKRATGRDCLELLERLSGTNYLGISYSVPLIKEMIRNQGADFTLFTGDGGDRILRDTRPVGNIRSTEELAAYIIDNNRMIDIDIVSEITEMGKEEFISRLAEILDGYTEQDQHMKYLRFIFTERCPGWHFQGEERNRSYVRVVAPFYSIKLFRYSMSLPDDLKKNFKLYSKVMKRISPRLASINNAEWNFPVTSWKLPIYSLLRRIYFTLPGKLKKMVELRRRRGRMMSAYGEKSNFMTCLKEQLQNCSGISDYLSLGGIESNIGSIDKLGLDHLFTLVSVIEKHYNGTSSLNNYNDIDLL